MPHYDLAILGSGSGNSLITPFWDGKRVALIDGGVFGGTCVNVGCIPTKMFAYPAGLAAVPADAGYDYKTIEDQGFPVLVVERDGVPAVVPNPRYRG